MVSVMWRAALFLAALASADGACADSFQAVPQGVYTAYTPTLAAGSGTITTASATGGYQITGKRLDLIINIAITTNGTGASVITVTLPSGLLLARGCALTGREGAVTGKGITASAGAGANNFGVSNASDGSYPGANGYNIVLSGSCEIQ